jgi:hypothetical protein
LPDHILDVVPEDFAAEKFCQVAPDAISFFRQLKRQPQRELVVVGIRVAQEQYVARLCCGNQLAAILCIPLGLHP